MASSLPLFLAIRRGDAETLAALLAGKQIDVNAPKRTLGKTPLCSAASKRMVHIARALVDAGADPNKRTITGATPLILAANNGNADMVAMLLAAGADPRIANGRGLTPLHVGLGSVDCVALLLAWSGADDARVSLNARSADGMTPLMIACASRKIDAEIVRLLLDAGALHDIETSKSMCALDFATSSVAKTRMLLDAGADVMHVDESGLTALMRAIHARNATLVKMFIDKTPAVVNVTCTENDRPSPLTLAACVGSARIAEMLIAAGAELEYEDSGGDTAFACARIAKNADVCSVLVSAGASEREPAKRRRTGEQIPQALRTLLGL